MGFPVSGFGERADIKMCPVLKRFRGRLVFKAHRLVYHSTLGSRVIKKKRKPRVGLPGFGFRVSYFEV